MKHAYYSDKMAERNGTVIYEREDGSEVECTAVETPPHTLGWDDVQDLGPVTRYLRQGSKAPSRLSIFR